MALATIALVGGTALQIYGQIKANRDQAEAELENSIWLEEQATFAAEASDREEDIFKHDADFQIGEQVSGFVKGGVELSGSALDTINTSFSRAEDELAAIRSQGRFQVKEALLKSNSARNRANSLKSFKTNAIQSATSILGAFTQSR